MKPTLLYRIASGLFRFVFGEPYVRIGSLNLRGRIVARPLP